MNVIRPNVKNKQTFNSSQTGEEPKFSSRSGKTSFSIRAGTSENAWRNSPRMARSALEAIAARNFRGSWKRYSEKEEEEEEEAKKEEEEEEEG